MAEELNTPQTVHVAVAPVSGTISLVEILTRLEQNIGGYTKRHPVRTAQSAQEVNRRVANVRRLAADLRAELDALGLTS